MTTFHVQRGVQFKTELYRGPDRNAWFKAVGDELAARKLTIQLAPGVEVKNADDLVALMGRFKNDRAALAAAIGLPAETTVENYIGDIIQALDDAVSPTSNVKDKMLDFRPSSDIGKLLGLDTKARYASGSTQFGKQGAQPTFSVLGIQLSRSAAPVDPLEGKAFIDSTTFAAGGYAGWNRDSVELEQVMGVTGMDPMALLDLLRSTNAAGRSVYQRLRKPEVCEAFTLGYSGVGIDDMKWDSESHRTREANRFVSLTVEGGRFEPDQRTGEREISLGTDKMDDVYYDTNKFDLLKNGMSVRGRARWDTDTEIRRLLVGVKADSQIDEFGLKRCAKVDVRNDSATPDDIKNLDTDVRRGKVAWNNADAPLDPLKGVYDKLSSKGALPNVGPHEKVLLMEPKFHVRSVRSRYHLNETSLSSIKQQYKACTEDKLKQVLDLVTKAKAGAQGADLETLGKLEKTGQGLLDGSLVTSLVTDKLKAIDPNMDVTLDAVKALMPKADGNSWNTPQNDTLSVEKKRVVSEAICEAFHTYAEEIDGARRLIAGAKDRALAPYADMFVRWQKAADKNLLNKNTYEPFLASYDKLVALPQADLDTQLKAFNDHGTAQKAAGDRRFRDFQPLTSDQLKALRPHLVNEMLDINHRQLEAGGTMASTLWFDEARSFYVPQSYRNTSNFLIDTTDLSEFVKHDAWGSIPEGERTPAKPLPKDKIFHAMLVNETQIELGLEKPYLDRMAEMQKGINVDRASLVMKFLEQGATPAADPAVHHDALKALLASPEKDAHLQKINAFIKAQGSALAPVTAEELARLEKDVFTAANRDLAVRTTPDKEKSLEGARFVFEQYRNAQKFIVEAKGERIMKVLKDAGAPQNLGWKQTDASKGDTGMKLLANP
ncbi:MAG: hypothetical protein AB2A00_25415 [Myxococcota bacterium]